MSEAIGSGARRGLWPRVGGNDLVLMLDVIRRSQERDRRIIMAGESMRMATADFRSCLDACSRDTDDDSAWSRCVEARAKMKAARRSFHDAQAGR